MPNYLSKKPECTVRKYRLMSFEIKAFLYTEQKIRDFETITNRLEHEEKMKVYDLCYWLKGRDIDYKLSFKYNKSKPIKWNIAKYYNFIRLKIRINKEYS